MRQLNDIAAERETMSVVVELTEAFEGIASMHIAQIKDQVLRSQTFFAELWQIYSQIRVDQEFHFGRRRGGHAINKDLLIVVTAEGSFSGDIGNRVVNAALKDYNPDNNDIIVVGTHGANQLLQSGIAFKRSFRLPLSDRNINVAPLVAEVQAYKSTNVFYPAYVSLMNQEVRSIQMSAWVSEMGKNVTAEQDVISEGTYIFEPSTHAVVDHLERSMISIMLGEIILESKLAQYASRFRANHVASDKAEDSYKDLTLLFNQAKRHLKDERAKEVLNGLRKAGSL